MPELTLPGCTPEPLMGYLKALGVFRLVAEQADQTATLKWAGGTAQLGSKFDRDGLIDFFLKEYRPTPVLAPWNGGSGFYDGGTQPLDDVASSSAERLALYRDTIARIREFLPRGKPKDEQKDALLLRCRAELADDVVPWLDVCFVLSESHERPGETKPSFFPLLGTGGNDGRLDFTNNFLQRLSDVIPFAAGAIPTPESAGWLAAAVFADALTPLDKAAVGQFNPGGIGGANGVQGNFEAGSRVNPWDFVLMIEGALLFAGSVARRYGANVAGRAVFPFSVESVAVGYGSATASEETTDGSRAELWLPLWGQPTTLPEVRHLFSEGRAQFGRRQARNAVEFALAVNLLGINRSVEAFVRYGFLKRNGLAFLAAPLGQVPVTPRPTARLLDDPPLTAWLDKLRSACRDKDKTPARYQTALRQIDRAMFEFANRSEHGNNGKYLTDVLMAVGSAERTLANGLSFCKDKYIRPLQGISPQWLDQAGDSAEFRLAASLAGVEGIAGVVGPIRCHLEEVEVTKFVNWSPGSTSAVWSNRLAEANLAAVFRRRQMEAFRAGQNRVPLRSPRPAPLADVLAFLTGDTDNDKLAALLWALTTVGWEDVEARLPNAASPGDTGVPCEFGVPRLLVEPLPLIPGRTRWVFGETAEPTTPDPDVFHVLASGQKGAVGVCVDRAARRLKSGGRPVIGHHNRHRAGRPLAVESSIPPDRLLAAMLFPLSSDDLRVIANAVLYPPDTED